MLLAYFPFPSLDVEQPTAICSYRFLKMSTHHQTLSRPALLKLPSYEDYFTSPSYQDSAKSETLQLPHQYIAAQVTQITPPIIESPNVISRAKLYTLHILVVVDLVISLGLVTLFFVGNHMSIINKTGYCATHIELTRIIDALPSTTLIGFVVGGLIIAKRRAFQRNPCMTGIDVWSDILLSLVGIVICLAFSSRRLENFFGCKCLPVLRLAVY